MTAWRGTKEFDAALVKMAERAGTITETALKEAADLGIVEIKAGIKSASGDLAGSVIATDVTTKGLGSYEIQFGPSGSLYARKVELGKRGAHSAPPYAYLVPGFNRAAPKFVDVFRKLWTNVHRG